MKKKTVSLLLVAAITVGMLAGCGGGKSSISQDGSSDTADSSEKVEMADAKDVDGTTITFWHSMGGVNGQAIDTLVKKFNDENEYGITVEAQYQGEYDDSLNKLKSAQIGNMGADLVQVYEIGTRFMIESGWTVPMQEMIDADNYDVSEIEPNLAAYYTIDNQLYSMPFNSSTPIMYYNKDMFDKAGITEIPDSLEAIDEIGDMKLNDDSIDRFKKAAEYYQALDPNQNLEEKITNLKTYKEARLNYARLMIKQASLADKKQDGAADAVKEAREAVDTYVPADEKWNIENYQDLLDLEATYSSDGGSGSSDDAGEAPPMC